MWFLDSGCSKHMTGNRDLFVDLTLKKLGYVNYGDNNKGKILGIGNVGSNSTMFIKNVLYVEGLKYNLLSISQLSDKGFNVSFNSEQCMISDKNESFKLIGKRENNMYLLSLHSVAVSNTCLVCNENDSWLWHRRIAHINMHHLSKLLKYDLISGLPSNLKFEKDRLCEACVKGKQTKSSFKPIKQVATSRPWNYFIWISLDQQGQRVWEVIIIA